VSLLTDEAVRAYKRLPVQSYSQRKRVLENVKGLVWIEPRETLDYVEHLCKLKPDFVIHGDDWKTGRQAELGIRDRVIEALKEWNGQLIEIPYTKGISSTLLIEQDYVNEDD
jgi:phosphoenolpyruvate phosphomutase